MRSGITPASSSRSTRILRTCVLPAPALAPTQAEAVGSEAVSCAAVVSRSNSSPCGRLTRVLWSRSSCVLPAVCSRPFRHPRKLRVGVEVVAETRPPHRPVGRLGMVELRHQLLEVGRAPSRMCRDVINLDIPPPPRRFAPRRRDIVQPLTGSSGTWAKPFASAIAASSGSCGASPLFACAHQDATRRRVL